MEITERGFEVKVNFSESEYKAINHYTNMLGFSNRAGFVRRHMVKALVECRKELEDLGEILAMPTSGQPLAGEKHCVSPRVERASLVKARQQN